MRKHIFQALWQQTVRNSTGIQSLPLDDGWYPSVPSSHETWCWPHRRSQTRSRAKSMKPWTSRRAKHNACGLRFWCRFLAQTWFTKLHHFERFGEAKSWIIPNLGILQPWLERIRCQCQVIFAAEGAKFSCSAIAELTWCRWSPCKSGCNWCTLW